MVNNHVLLYNRDVLPHYKQPPQILDILHQKSDFRFSLMTVSEELFSKVYYRRRREYEAGHRHDVYHIILCLSGRNRFLLDDKLCENQKGTLIITSPGQRHEFRPFSKGTLLYRNVTFRLQGQTGDLQIPFVKLLELYLGIELQDVKMPVVLEKRPFHELAALMGQLRKELSFENNNTFSAYRLILDILGLLGREVYTFREKTSFSIPTPLENTRDMIRRNFKEKLSLSELASNANLSKGHFSREFKKAFKITPMDYQRNLRIENAKVLLKMSNESLKSMAEQLGFNDVYHFAKVFKQQTGKPPAAYRRIHTRSMKSMY